MIHENSWELFEWDIIACLRRDSKAGDRTGRGRAMGLARKPEPMAESLLFRRIPMRILSIETSCDETAISLLEISGPIEKPDIKVLGNTLLSQAQLHAEYGGVYPNLAKREHIKNLPILLEETLREAGESHTAPNIDFIAVTAGPGLEPALWTGIGFAEGLSERWGKPVVPVNHMEGHIFSVLYGLEGPLGLPALALLVSGGHTELVHIRGFGDYEIIGKTLDDAAGEAYDKAARMLGLPYPGGPEISRLAEASRQSGRTPSFELPRPMIRSNDLNFSFSGLKTAVLYKIRAQAQVDGTFVEEMARAFEDAAVEVLVDKTRRALEGLGNINTLIVAGGVSANRHLKVEMQKMADKFGSLRLLLPEKLLSTDNAIMIGIAGYVEATLNPEILSHSGKIAAKGNLSINTGVIKK
jgi:N6-L-threonylcarbamoyladenine synthase